jgi:hypothetical protein
MTNPLSSRWLLLFLPLLLGLAALTGCGGGAAGKVVPVTGKITLDGEPLTAGTITFEPDDSKGNKSKSPAGGMVDASGNYKLFTSGKEGAVVGWYKVGVSPVGMQMGGMAPLPESGKLTDPNKNVGPSGGAVNKKYQLPATSGLSIEVVEKPEAGAYDLKVTK